MQRSTSDDTQAGGGQSAAHEAVREQHRDERMEDYVEAILRLRKNSEGVRVVDLQGVFGVSHVTVIRILDRLEKEGLVVRRPEGIGLTEMGLRLAEECYERHRTVEAFLRGLGISEAVASRDAEGIEHHLSEETLEAMRDFLRKSR